MEDIYREIYAVNGITDLKFPEHYQISRLLGCVEVVGCVTCEELVSWKELPEGVRLEGQTDYCWLCEQPQIYEAAARGLCQVNVPLPVKFPLPDPRDLFLLKPGSVASKLSDSKASKTEKPPSLNVAIAGARAAAMQFSKNSSQSTIQDGDMPASARTQNKFKEDIQESDSESAGRSNAKDLVSSVVHNSSMTSKGNKLHSSFS